MTDSPFDAYDIHRIDQASPEAWDDVDELANDRETARRLAERGQDVYAVELARDLDAQTGSRMALAGVAAMATIRRVQERDERNELRAEVERLRAVLNEIHNLHTDSPAGVCPSCYRLNETSDTDDGLVDWPCPTLRAMGVEPTFPLKRGVS